MQKPLDFLIEEQTSVSVRVSVKKKQSEIQTLSGLTLTLFLWLRRESLPAVRQGTYIKSLGSKKRGCLISEAASFFFDGFRQLPVEKANK